MVAVRYSGRVARQARRWETRRASRAFLGAVGGAVVALSPASVRAEDACPDVAERAQESRAKGHLLDAKKDLLRCASDSCPKIIRRDCVVWLDEVQRAIPSITVVPRHVGKDVAARVRIDGVDAGAEPRQLDPGSHTVDVDADGFRAVRDRILVRAGETTRLVSVELERLEAPKPVPPPARPPPAPPSALGPVLVGAAGLAGLATFGVFQFVGRSQRSDIEDGCGRNSTCSSDDLAPARRSFVISGVGLAVGAAALTAAALWFFLQPRARSTGAAPVTFSF